MRKEALKELEAINHDIPQIKIMPIIDTSEYISRSISNVGSSAVYGGLLAIVVLLVFLRNVRSTIIIATAIPVSIIATFALLYFGGYTLNIMTLGGLALGIGMLVDNAIVVLENIFRMRENGVGLEKAAIEGTEEVTAAIIASTLTTLAVFLPLVFMRGMSGVMFKQLSIVVAFSLMCSLIAALTLVPMLCERVLPALSKDSTAKKTMGKKLYDITGLFFKSLENNYKAMLHVALNHRIAVIISAAILLGASLLLVPYVGAELMPATDEGEVRVNVEMQVGTKLDLVDEKMKEIEAIVNKNVPEARNVVTSIGGGGYRTSGSNNGELRISLVSQSQRSRSSDDIAADLRKKLSNLPGVKVRTRSGQGLFILRMGSSGDDRIQVEIRGHDLDTADALALQVRDLIQSVDGIADTQISRESGSPEELIVIDRQKAANMNLTVSKIANALQTILSGSTTGYFRQGGDEFTILVKLKNAEQMNLDDILNLTLVNSQNEPVVLKNVVNIVPQSGPVMIERLDQERVVTVSADPGERPLSAALADVQKLLATIPVPRDFSIAIGGDFEEQQKSFHELLLSCILALILVYMVMACQYESLRDPFVVMFSVPLAAIGVILMLFFTGTTFNVQSFIGCIMLGGIVVNNAILLVDHTNLLRRRDSMPLREAIEEAGRRRLRPILMTATTTVFGLVPLALGLGEGGEAQAPMARVVIGGLISSTFITLIFVPVVYSIFERKHFSKM